MSILISFGCGDKNIWGKKRWVSERFLDDVIQYYPDDEILRNEIRDAIIFECLTVENLQNNLQNKVLAALKEVANITLLDQNHPCLNWAQELKNDLEGQKVYKDAISELLIMIKNYENGLP